MALITVQVDHYHHIPQPPEIPASIQERLDHIMTTQAELAQQITDLTAQNERARAEVLAKIADMQAAIDAAGAVDPAVLEAF
ncbi:MAG: hypothetical protein KAY54_06375, partial [Burkholderiaceae bacterium]|nr:hypothetical protein [Burkholderiaceae bacterium]